MKITPARLSFRRSGFTLVELLLAATVIALLLAVLVAITGHVSATWAYTSGKIEQFRGARTAFETMTRRLAAATLNTYWDYDNPANPTRYERRSELRFLCGPADAVIGDERPGTRVTHSVFFQAPLGFTDRVAPPAAGDPGDRGLESLLNTWGYFVELRDDRLTRPPFLTEAIAPPRTRFRLMELMQPAEQMNIYPFTSGWLDPKKPASGLRTESYTGTDWFRPLLSAPQAPVHVLAENIIALIITPRLPRSEEEALPGAADAGRDFSPLAPDYRYDSTTRNADPQLDPRHRLPPLLQVTMVALDEASAARLALDAHAANRFGVQGKFRDTHRFTAELSTTGGDRAALEQRLIELKLSYRIFTTQVALKTARWSREQSE